jgi:hypothetical protein
METLMVDLFVEADRQTPRQIVHDLDATDDPLHGQQEGRFFHGCQDKCRHLPLYVTCGGHLLAAKLRRSNIDGAAGSRPSWSASSVGSERAGRRFAACGARRSSGFARVGLMAWCEAHDVDFLLGLARNKRLAKEIEWHIARAGVESRPTGEPARRFKDFRYTTRKSWSRRHRVIGPFDRLRKRSRVDPRRGQSALSSSLHSLRLSCSVLCAASASSTLASPRRLAAPSEIHALLAEAAR